MKRTAIRKVSPARRRQQRQRVKALHVVMKRCDGKCELQIQGTCTWWAVDAHESILRSAGGDPTDPANIVATCRECHEFAHGHPIAAREMGWIVSGHGRESR